MIIRNNQKYFLMIKRLSIKISSIPPVEMESPATGRLADKNELD